MSRLTTLVIAIVLAFPTEAAACVLGWGSDCPPSDTESATQISKSINGTKIGQFEIKIHIIEDGASIANSMNTYPQEIEKVRQGLTVITGSGDCSTLNNMFPSYHGLYIAQNCEFAREMLRKGVAELVINEKRFSTNVDIYVDLSLTDAGKAIINKYLINANPDRIIVGTGELQFSRVVRTSVASNFGQVAAEVQFEYNAVPNEFSDIAKQSGSKPTEAHKGVGTAVLVKWSDGWKLASAPALSE
jgi:hypothetical protein